MCKYCRVKVVQEDKTFVEKSNNVVPIMNIGEGHNWFEVQINRYILESDHEGESVRKNELILEQAIEINDSLYSVQEKHITIKYCPFCGEEL